MPTSRAIGEPQTRTYSTPGAGVVLTRNPISYADSHLLGQLRDRSRRCAADTPQNIGEDFMGQRPAPDLRVAAGDVQVVVRAALRQHGVEALVVDALVQLHRGAAVAQLDRGGGPVQLHVGGTEAGPVVVVVAAQGTGRLLGAAHQVTDGGAVADPGRGHRTVE